MVHNKNTIFYQRHNQERHIEIIHQLILFSLLAEGGQCIQSKLWKMRIQGLFTEKPKIWVLFPVRGEGNRFIKWIAVKRVAGRKEQR